LPLNTVRLSDGIRGKGRGEVNSYEFTGRVASPVFFSGPRAENWVSLQILSHRFCLQSLQVPYGRL